MPFPKKQWNSEAYNADFGFVSKYGEDVPDMITVPNGSFVVDLGCGIDSKTKCDIIKKAVEICRPRLYSGGQWTVDYVRLRMKAIKN